MDCVKNGVCFAYNLPNQSAERTQRNQPSDACLMSRNGGVGAEICAKLSETVWLAGA